MLMKQHVNKEVRRDSFITELKYKLNKRRVKNCLLFSSHLEHLLHRFSICSYCYHDSLTLAEDAAYVIGMILLNEKAQEIKDIGKKKSKLYWMFLHLQNACLILEASRGGGQIKSPPQSFWF